MFVAFLVFFLIKVIRSLKKERKKFFKSYWNLIEICKLALCIAGVTMYSYRLVFWNLALDSLPSESQSKEKGQFVNLQQLAVWDEIFNYITSVVVFISILKFVRMLRFNRRMALLGSTLKYASKDLIHFGVVFFVIFFSFGQFGYLIFGSALYNFSNFTLAVETLFTMMLGRFGYSEMKAAHELFGRLFFFSFMILVYMVLFNVFVTVLVGAYQTVKSDNDKQSNEYEMVDFILNRFKLFIGVSSQTVKPRKTKGTPERTTCSETTLVSESSGIEDLNVRLEIIMNRIDALQMQEGQFTRKETGTIYSTMDEITLKVESPNFEDARNVSPSWSENTKLIT
ncbi:polycystin-2-like protein 2 [Glandiceps talaboti]